MMKRNISLIGALLSGVLFVFVACTALFISASSANATCGGTFDSFADTGTSAQNIGFSSSSTFSSASPNVSISDISKDSLQFPNLAKSTTSSTAKTAESLNTNNLNQFARTMSQIKHKLSQEPLSPPGDKAIAEKYSNALIIFNEGRRIHAPDRAIIIALMAAIQESRLINLTGGDRDSVGIFQQREPWAAQWRAEHPNYKDDPRTAIDPRTSPVFSSIMFYEALFKVKDWQYLSPNDAAQEVQHSGFPSAYAGWQSGATVLLQSLNGSPGGLDELSAIDCWTNSGPTTVIDDTSKYRNGNIPDEALVQVAGPAKNNQTNYMTSGHGIPERLSPAAAGYALALNAAFKQRWGEPMCLLDGYRPYNEQVIVAGPMAAAPGSSMHGWGAAMDLKCAGQQIHIWNSPQRNWMVENAPKFGWISPPWAQPGASSQTEAWHWEYCGEMHVMAKYAECAKIVKGLAPNSAAAGNKVANYAQGMLGTPYSWGGGNIKGPTKGIRDGSGNDGTHTVGFDCSGLVIYAVYNATGIELPHSARSQGTDSRGTTISSKNDLQPGDIISFISPGRVDHVGIYLGNGKMIHAPRPGSDVQVTTVIGSPYYETAQWHIKRYG